MGNRSELHSHLNSLLEQPEVGPRTGRGVRIADVLIERRSRQRSSTPFGTFLTAAREQPMLPPVSSEPAALRRFHVSGDEIRVPRAAEVHLAPRPRLQPNPTPSRFASLPLITLDTSVGLEEITR